MTITAKYPSKCAHCGGAISIGSKIEWSKGSPARHTTCSASLDGILAYRRSVQRADSPARGKRTGCSCGSIEDTPRKSDCASCRFENYDQ